MGIGAAAALAATSTGAAGFMGVPDQVCGLVEESCTDRLFAAEDRLLHAAIGLGVIAAITTAIGAPLYASGRNAEKKQAVSFVAAPTFGAQGPGVAARLALRF